VVAFFNTHSHGVRYLLHFDSESQLHMLLLSVNLYRDCTKINQLARFAGKKKKKNCTEIFESSHFIYDSIFYSLSSLNKLSLLSSRENVTRLIFGTEFSLSQLTKYLGGGGGKATFHPVAPIYVLKEIVSGFELYNLL
jgi:hypothetical protein